MIIVFSIFKIDENHIFNFISLYLINGINSTIQFTEEINQEKKIMICIFNKNLISSLDINIDREVNLSQFILVTDKSYEQSGSEVHLNGGVLGETTITKGFTRPCYLGNDAPDTSSRLNYYWYSSNNNVATISSYGTITAVGVGTTIIQSVYKSDSTKKGTYKYNSRFKIKIYLIVTKNKRLIGVNRNINSFSYNFFENKCSLD
ncbi:MAG: hypothetical protein KIC61_02205 [Staphylococcus sp.]|nr:hypothetical protein [Staphylococcus sp.]